MVTPEPHPPAANHGAVPERIAELTRALEHETALVTELQDALIHQRGAVATSEATAVNASVDLIGRLLLALEEARGARSAIVASLTGDGALPIDRLETAIGEPLPAALEGARTGLRRAAAGVAREVSINRVVLRRAVESGEAFLQALFSTALDAPSSYPAPERRDETTRGILLNRRA